MSETTRRMSEFLDRLLDSSRMIGSIRLDTDGRVTGANETFARGAGRSAAAIIGLNVEALVAAHEGPRLLAWCRGNTDSLARGTPVSFVDADGAPYTLWCHVEGVEDGVLIVAEPDLEADAPVAHELLRLNNEMATLARENVRRRREAEEAQARLADAHEELRTSYWHLHKIQEFMPVCMRCGKVKSTESSWQSVSEYFLENRILMSHGFCPVCASAELAAFGLSEED